MDRQTAIDRITETENLTDGLEDDDANWLLDWGIAQVDGLVTGIKDEDAAGEKLNQLMSVMRTLNQIAADRAAKSPDALASDISTFLERYQQAFGAPKTATPATTAPAGANTAPPTSQKAPTGPATAAAENEPPASGQAPAGASTQTPAKKDEAAPAALPVSAGPSPAPTPASGAPATNTTANTTTATAPQASQAPDQVAQAANKVAGMGPKEAMQYLLSLAEAGAPAA